MPTILYADDHPNIREFCRQELEDDGYQVVVARDGSEALQAASHCRPDVIVLDVFMPGIDGLETMRRIQTTQPEIPVVLFTSFDDICQRDARSWQATACVEKRDDLTELKQVVAAVLDARRHNQPYRIGLPPRTRV